MFNYTDAYLKTRVTNAIEKQAIADVAVSGNFPDEWNQRLAIIRAYIPTCLEFGGAAGDTFESKLTHYRKEYDFTLAQAKRALAAKDTTQNIPIFSIPIERA